MKSKIAVISASLGGFDRLMTHFPQSLPYDYFLFTDDNFPPRFNAMTPRLQAKIPKFFGWQMIPGYEIYLWIDANLTLIDKDSLKFFFNNLGTDYDLVALKHPRRNTVYWESRYLQRGLKQGSRYLAGRYTNELVSEQMKEINSDPNFVDDLLVLGGVFMYRNNSLIQKTLTEWWYHVSRYLIMDQCSFAYVLKKNKVNVNALDENLYLSKLIKQTGHTKHY